MKITLAGILCCVLLQRCRSQSEKIHPTVEDIIFSVYASGTIKAINQYEVFSKVSGIVKKVYVTENDTVHVGSRVICITNEIGQLNTKNAELAASFNTVYSNREKIQELRSNILLAHSRYSIDSLNYTRQKNLYSSGIGSRNELEQRELLMLSSKTALESATESYTAVLKQLAYNEKQSENNLLISRSAEEDYIISSEIDGKIYSVTKVEGEAVTPTIPLAVVGDAKYFYIELQVDENDIRRIDSGQTAIIAMDSYPGRTFKARIRKINPIMDVRTHTFMVEADFIKQPDKLFPFLTAEANIIIEEKKNALVIPRSYVINDSIVRLKSGKRKISTGLKDYEKVEVLSGLQQSDVIIKPL